MKQHWTQIELINSWTLSQEEINAINRRECKLVYAFKMKHFDIHGLVANQDTNVPIAVIDFLKKQLDITEQGLSNYQWNDRAARQHNAEIRQFYGFIKFEKETYELVSKFLNNNIIIQGISKGEALTEVLAYLHNKKIVPPSIDKLRRYINSIYQQYEDILFDLIDKKLNNKNRKAIDMLVATHKNMDSILSFLRSNTGKISTPTIKEEVSKIEYIKNTGVLEKELMFIIPKKVLKKYHDKLSILKVSDLMVIKNANPQKYYGLLCSFCVYRGGKILDALTEIFIRRFHKIEQKARSKAKQELWDQEEKSSILFDSMIDISIEQPDEAIKNSIYPGVGGKERLEKAKLLRENSKNTKQQLEYKHLKKLYLHHHKDNIFMILENFEMESHNKNNVLSAILEIIRKSDNPQYQEEFYPLTHKMPIEGVVAAIDFNVIQTSDKKILKTYYELAVLKKLRKELRCKNIWIRYSLKYSDPEKNFPKDFYSRPEHYCELLNLQRDGQTQISEIKKELLAVSREFNDTLPSNDKVRIGKKRGKPHIFITPHAAQEEPQNITILKHEILKKWGNLGLLDILKECDFRIGLTTEIIAIADKSIISYDKLRQRLLLCIYAIATNTEFKRICTGIDDITEQDLEYVKKRYLTPEVMRYIIRKLIDSTVEIRDPSIWGNLKSLIASDSTKIASWEENLMSEFHIRYKGSGVMAYWHVEKKALCISSQLRRCSDPEVPSMLCGLINHKTKVKIDGHSTDTHGQSLIAFGLCYLLGIELRPRIKGIGKLKIAKVDKGVAQGIYSNIKDVIGRPINWQLIVDNYHEMVKYVSAVKLGTTEVDVILKQLIVENIQSPVYKALLELGRATRSIFICKYLMSEEMRIEINEALNVIENWNSGNNFVFFGRKGVISSNDETDQELSILCLHGVQSSLVYINTLLEQEIIEDLNFKSSLTLEDKRAITPLFYHHVSQYGTYNLDMNTRIPIKG